MTVSLKQNVLVQKNVGLKSNSGFSWPYHLFQFEKLEGVPELGVIVEQAEGESDRDDRLCLPQTPGDVLDTGPIIPLPSPDRHLQHQRQVRANLHFLHWFLAEFYYNKIRENCNYSDSPAFEHK